MHQIVTLVAKYFIVLPVFGLLFALWKAKTSERKHVLLELVVSAAVAALLVKLATTLYHDPRPFVRDGVIPYFTGSTDNGFPSDHTVFSSLLACVVLGVSRKLGTVLLVVAALIGTARVIAGVHHAIDIIGGLAIAAASYGIAVLLVRIYKHRVMNNASS